MDLEADDRFVACAHAVLFRERCTTNACKLGRLRPRMRCSTDPRVPSSSRSLARLLERSLPIGLLGLALIGVPVLIFQPEGLPRMRALEKELGEVSAENAELRRDIAHLRVEVKDLRDDPAAVERIARDQLGLVRKSEIVFQFGKSR